MDSGWEESEIQNDADITINEQPNDDSDWEDADDDVLAEAINAVDALTSNPSEVSIPPLDAPQSDTMVLTPHSIENGNDQETPPPEDSFGISFGVPKFQGFQTGSGKTAFQTNLSALEAARKLLGFDEDFDESEFMPTSASNSRNNDKNPSNLDHTIPSSQVQSGNQLDSPPSLSQSLTSKLHRNQSPTSVVTTPVSSQHLQEPEKPQQSIQFKSAFAKNLKPAVRTDPKVSLHPIVRPSGSPNQNAVSTPLPTRMADALPPNLRVPPQSPFKSVKPTVAGSPQRNVGLSRTSLHPNSTTSTPHSTFNTPQSKFSTPQKARTDIQPVRLFVDKKPLPKSLPQTDSKTAIPQSRVAQPISPPHSPRSPHSLHSQLFSPTTKLRMGLTRTRPLLPPPPPPPPAHRHSAPLASIRTPSYPSQSHLPSSQTEDPSISPDLVMLASLVQNTWQFTSSDIHPSITDTIQSQMNEKTFSQVVCLSKFIHTVQSVIHPPLQTVESNHSSPSSETSKRDYLSSLFCFNPELSSVPLSSFSLNQHPLHFRRSLPTSSVSAVFFAFVLSDFPTFQPPSLLTISEEPDHWGILEAYSALVTLFPQFDSEDLLSLKWVVNHWRWIIWKLSGYDRSFSEGRSPTFCTPQNVIYQLLHRVYVEFEQAKRSPIRKILEGDEAPGKHMVLTVSRCQVTETLGLHLDNSEERIKRKEERERERREEIEEMGLSLGLLDEALEQASSPSASTEQTSVQIEVTDGWYPVTATLDTHLAKYLEQGKIVEGMKIRVCHAQLLNLSGNGHPLSLNEPVGFDVFEKEWERRKSLLGDLNDRLDATLNPSIGEKRSKLEEFDELHPQTDSSLFSSLFANVLNPQNLSSLIPSSPALLLHVNSTRRAKWDAKLGFQKDPAFPILLKSVKPNGISKLAERKQEDESGPVPMCVVCVQRVYEMVYLVDHRPVMREDAEEEMSQGKQKSSLDEDERQATQSVTRTVRCAASQRLAEQETEKILQKETDEMRSTFEKELERMQEQLVKEMMKRVQRKIGQKSGRSDSDASTLDEQILEQQNQLSIKFQRNLEDKALDLNRQSRPFIKLKVRDVLELPRPDSVDSSEPFVPQSVFLTVWGPPLRDGDTEGIGEMGLACSMSVEDDPSQSDQPDDGWKLVQPQTHPSGDTLFEEGAIMVVYYLNPGRISLERPYRFLPFERDEIGIGTHRGLLYGRSYPIDMFSAPQFLEANSESHLTPEDGIQRDSLDEHLSGDSDKIPPSTEPTKETESVNDQSNEIIQKDNNPKPNQLTKTLSIHESDVSTPLIFSEPFDGVDSPSSEELSAVGFMRVPFTPLQSVSRTVWRRIPFTRLFPCISMPNHHVTSNVIQHEPFRHLLTPPPALTLSPTYFTPRQPSTLSDLSAAPIGTEFDGFFLVLFVSELEHSQRRTWMLRNSRANPHTSQGYAELFLLLTDHTSSPRGHKHNITDYPLLSLRIRRDASFFPFFSRSSNSSTVFSEGCLLCVKNAVIAAPDTLHHVLSAHAPEEADIRVIPNAVPLPRSFSSNAPTSTQSTPLPPSIPQLFIPVAQSLQKWRDTMFEAMNEREQAIDDGADADTLPKSTLDLIIDSVHFLVGKSLI